MVNNSFDDVALQLIKSSAVCPMCHGGRSNKKVQSISAQIIEKTEDKGIFYLKCNNCKASMISVISTSENAGNAIVFMTDLKPEEISKFRKQEPININDVKEIKNNK